MTHLKRLKTAKEWPSTRKGTAFIVRTLSKKGVPLLIILRDMLKIVKNRKEAKKALRNKSVLVNDRPVKNEKIGMTIFDTISLVPSKINYRVTLNKKGKFEVEEIGEKESKKKIAKIMNKKILRGKKTQINLNDGRNFISEKPCRRNDSVLINLENKKIEKFLPLEKNSNVLVFAGKHAGERGKIEKMIPERKMAKINNGKDKVNILIKQLMAVE